MEVWKDIKGYEGLYQVSNLGNVKSLAREKYGNGKSILKVQEIILRPGMNDKGYYYVALNKDSKAKSCAVHRLVAETFIERIDGKKFVNHINAIKSDNRVENLEWCTHMENMQHAHKLGLIPYKRGVKHHKAKLTDAQVLAIREDNRFQYIIAKDYGVSQGMIGFIKRRKNWNHI